MRARPLLLLLLLALAAGLPGLARALPPPDIEGYRFYAFLNISAVVEEPLSNLVRRELPEHPELWPRIEQYVRAEFPQAFASGRRGLLRRNAAIRLPLYRLPSQQATAAPPPPPPPEPEEAVVGALTDADETVQRQNSRGRRSDIRAINDIHRGDTLSTGARTAATLRLLDGTLILLRPDSSVLIKDFRFAQNDGHAGALQLALLKGSMRTVSGMIAKDPRSRYLMETPGGSVTVRGTDYALRWCPRADDCRLEGAAVATGLYAGVLEGGIDLANDQGASPANAGEVVRVAQPGAAAQPAPEMAALVFTPEELVQLPRPAKPCQRGPRDTVVFEDCRAR